LKQYNELRDSRNIPEGDRQMGGHAGGGEGGTNILHPPISTPATALDPAMCGTYNQLLAVHP